MVEIHLTNGETGYDAVGEYIERYWDHHGMGDVVVALSISYDGINYDTDNEIVTPDTSGVKFMMEFLNDWWEGQKYIRIFGIKAVREMQISGGIYEEVNK